MSYKKRRKWSRRNGSFERIFGKRSDKNKINAFWRFWMQWQTFWPPQGTLTRGKRDFVRRCLSLPLYICSSCLDLVKKLHARGHSCTWDGVVIAHIYL